MYWKLKLSLFPIFLEKGKKYNVQNEVKNEKEETFLNWLSLFAHEWSMAQNGENRTNDNSPKGNNEISQ